MADTTDKIFTLKSFSPVGFKYPNYPVKICPICRGLLIDSCAECKINHRDIDKCVVINKDDVDYHRHCYLLISSKQTKDDSI